MLKIGAVPTTFYFEDHQGIELIGEVLELEGVVKNDPIFEMPIEYFESETLFVQKIRKNNQDSKPLELVVEFMVCNEAQNACRLIRNIH